MAQSLRVRGGGPPLLGTCRVPGDKSVSHRGLLLGAIGDGPSRLRGFLNGRDCHATLQVIRDLGVQVELAGVDELLVHGVGLGGLREPRRVLEIARLLAPLPRRRTVRLISFGTEEQQRRFVPPVLAGEMTLPDIVLNSLDWYRDNAITLHAGWRVSSVDRVKRLVHAQNAAGETISTEYDRLLLATGSEVHLALAEHPRPSAALLVGGVLGGLAWLIVASGVIALFAAVAAFVFVLLGVALGATATGLRILLGADRPYGD